MFYPSDLNELYATQRLCYLNPGQPTSRGCIAFLFSNNIEDSIRISMYRENFKDMKKYKYFYRDLVYSGRIMNKRFRIRDLNERKEIISEVEKETDLMFYKALSIPKNFNMNMYVDLSKHYSIFQYTTQNCTPIVKMTWFWKYFDIVLNDPKFSNYNEKVVLIPVSEKINLTGDIRKNIDNPIFMFYYTLYRNPSLCKNIDMDFLFYSGKYCMKWNPSHSSKVASGEKKAHVQFKEQMRRLLSHVNIDEVFDDEKIEKEDEIATVANTLKNEVYNFTGDQEEVITDLKEVKPSEEKIKIDKKIDEVVAKVSKEKESTPKKAQPEKTKTADTKASKASTSKTTVTSTSSKKVTKEEPVDDEETSAEVDNNISTKAQEELNHDKQFVEELYKATMNEYTPKSRAMTARDLKIRNEQENVKFGDETLSQLEKIKMQDVKIPVNNIASVLHSTNKNLYNVRFSNFEKTYNEKMMKKDIAGVFTSLNDKSLPMYVIKTDIRDTSDELNYKETWSVTLEDTLRNRHTITVDIPKFVDDKFMYLGGNKKLILKQNFFYPVVKVGEDTVQIVTNENKMIIHRVDNRTTSTTSRLNKLIETDDKALTYFKAGNAYPLNNDYITTVEYDELSKKFLYFKTDKCQIFFSRQMSDDYAEKHNIKLDKIQDKKMFIGQENGKEIFIDYDSQKTDSGDQIMDIIVRNLPEDMQKIYQNAKTQKRLMYANVTTMHKAIPVGLLLGYWEGIETLMKKAGIEYRLTEKYPTDLKPTESVLRFSDCYLIYEEDIPKGLLMNGYRIIDTTKYKLIDYNTKDPYLEYFCKVYGKMSIANPLMNTYEFTIDHITKEILEDTNLPTDIVNLMIYAVKLLADNRYLTEIDQRLSRVRSNEIVAAILYDAVAKNYVNYKNSNGKNKLSIPRDIVIKTLLGLKTVEDTSTLNPVLELERTHTVLQKGWRGINLDDSYTVEKRAYDKSMIGTIGPTSSPDGGVGVQRVLTVEPCISNIRGFVDQPKDINTLKDVNLFSPGEMLTPLAVTRDDSTRMGHAIKQSKHVIFAKGSSPVLITNGAEEACRFDLSKDFVINAEEDGEVIEYNEKEKIIICKYKSGKCQAIDLNPKIVKNGGGGFYLSNVMATNLKMGSKFKKNEVLAWHKDFFTNNLNGNRMNLGVLIKVALMSTYNTYEDSSCITHKLSEDATTAMCFNRQVVVGKNSTVDYIAKIGDHINIGDTLIQFDTSFEDSELNRMLDSISDELREGVMEDSRNDIKSKRAGVIEDIKIYSTVDLEELSPSLREIVGSYYKKINNKKKLLEKYDPDGSLVKCGIIFNQTTKKVVPNKYGVILGQKVEDSVLIEFYIKHEEALVVGSKMAYYTGIKTVIGEILPKGYEPYSEYRPDEEVTSLIATNSILARMTPSIVLVSLGNKCLIELKRQLKDMYDKNTNLETSKKEMTEFIYKFFTAFDKTGTNTEKYKSMFDSMSPKQFREYFKMLFADEKAYLVLDIVDYENTIVIEDIERAAKVLNIPLFEYVYLPHLTMDKDNVIRTQLKVPVGYVHIKPTQQTISKKNGISTSIDTRSATTGQVTGIDKNGRESDLENIMLTSLGMKNTLKELNGPRADDVVMKRQMLMEIAEKGYVTLDELDDDVTNKTTLNTANVYLLGMGLDSDLVTKGLMLKQTLKDEL